MKEPSSLKWLVNRLRVMSMAEMGYRIGQTCRGLLTRFESPPELIATQSAAIRSWIKLPPSIREMDAAPYLAEADAVLAGHVPLFSAQTVSVGALPDWNRNPYPASGDIKYLWELNRHLHWVRLAQAYVLSTDVRYCRGLAAQIRSWLDQCPPDKTGKSPNWSSASELADRLINWSMVWQLLGGWDSVLFHDADGAALRSRWLASIWAHCCAVSRNLSRHSSANNHLIGELTGLYVAAHTWPLSAQSAAWARQAKAELEREAILQHFADGANREQAFGYQAFTIEYLMVAGICGQRTGDPFSPGYWDVLRRACRFFRSVKNVQGEMPMVGDSDDGAVLRLETRDGMSRPAVMLNRCDSIFGDDVADSAKQGAQWLGAERLLQAQHGETPKTDWEFAGSGYFIFGSGFDSSDEIKGLVDCGALGFLGIAAHGHADALAICLSIAGESCLVDPGTYAYGDDYQWRQYFRGTSAHNTVRVDGLDQSQAGGRFLWLSKAQARVEKTPLSPEQFEFAGSHDGYMRLHDPVRHTRYIAFDASLKRLLVKDDIAAKTSHQIEQFWHFAPGVEVQLGDDGVVTARGRRFDVEMRWSASGVAVNIVRGQLDPPLGWYSSGYGMKEPATAVRVSTSSCPVSIETHCRINIRHSVRQ